MTDTSTAASGAATAATTSAPASQPAPSSPAPSTPSTTDAATTPGAAPSAPPAKRQTADEIMEEELAKVTPAAPGAEPEGKAPKEPTQKTDAQETEEPPKDPKAAKESLEEEFPEAQTPEHYRGVFKQHPELRGRYYRDKIYTDELKLTVKEAREWRALHPNLASVRESFQDGQALREIAEDYRTAPEKTLEFLRSVDGNSFKAISEKILAEELADPAKFYEARPALLRPMVDLAAERMVRAFLSDPDEDSQFVGKYIYQALQRSRANQQQQAAAPKPEAPPEIMKELEELRTEKRTRTNEQQQAYTKLVVAESKKLVDKRFLSEIAKYDPSNIFSEEDRADMAEECYRKLNAKLAAKEGYRGTLARKLAGTDRTEVLEFIDGHVKAEAPDIVSEITGKWRKRVLSANDRLIKQLDAKAGVKSDAPAATPAAVTPPNRPLTYDEKAEQIFQESLRAISSR